MPAVFQKYANGTPPLLAMICILLSVVTIVFFILFSFVPQYTSIKKTRLNIKTLSDELKVQQTILPVFEKAGKLNENLFEPDLPFPDRSKLARQNISEFFNTFQNLAMKHHLDLIDNKLDPEFLTQSSGSILVYLELKGRLQDLRPFLISLVSLPFFETIEKISVHPDYNEKKRFSIHPRFNVEKKI